MTDLHKRLSALFADDDEKLADDDEKHEEVPKMKGKAELNALLLLGKNYQRLCDINMGADVNSITLKRVPEPLVDFFVEKIREVIDGERFKALDQYKAAAQAYAKATAE